MNKYITICMIALVLIAGCKGTPKADVVETPSVAVDTSSAVDTTADIAPAEELDEELETENLDTVGAALDNLTW
ncbi:MAG TPA: hypothetical protein VJK72_04195 [Candidatus Nanoarchaeia archaeon]|nr:hypothetical protein [Candidatus Nanoarchaeia archaeon]